MRVCAQVGALCATAALAVLGGCGFGGSQAGAGKTLNWYIFNEPGGANEENIKTCNKQANGRYTISYQRLPTDANQQRELIVRRLAAEDSSVDLIGMDVIWTAEFAQAGWIEPWEGERERQATQGKLEGPLKTVQYQDRAWGIPYTTNTQLLWFRKDRAEKPPDDVTWDELIDQAERRDTAIEVQGAQYEGLTVLVNSLVAGAGGALIDQEGEVRVDDTARRAAEVISKLAGSQAAPPGIATAREDQAKSGFESGRSDYQTNYTFIYPSAAENKGEEFQKNIGWARYPRTEPDQPSRPPIGGINIGIGAFSDNKELAYEAATCLAQVKNQEVAAELGGLPPTSEAAYEREKVKQALPFSELLRVSLENGAARPVNPAYSDISLAVQKTFHPPDGIDPGAIEGSLRERMEKAAEGKIF